MFANLARLRFGKIALLTGVIILGSSAVAAAAPAHGPGHKAHGHGLYGAVVTSVNGVSTAGTCGVADSSGTFTIVGEDLVILTVDVSTTTTFIDAADATPSLADVCVAQHVGVTGTNAAGTVTANAVTVLPPKPVSAEGVVTSVNGIATAGTCGVQDTSGAFSFVGRRLHIVTAEVSSATVFSDAADATPSFGDLCVADHVKIVGTVLAGVLSATTVLVVAPKADRTAGIVTSVNGSAASGACGVAGAAGVFTLEPGRHQRQVTIEVATTTQFSDASDPTPSFADICVANRVNALGTFASGALAATSVAVVPPNTGRDTGLVTSVNGSSVAGSCGVAASSGAFSLVGNWRRGIVTVEVSTTTKFFDAADASASFADICVGGHVGVLGTLSSKILTASDVAVLPASHGHSGHKATSRKGHHRR
jgi:hypothetical protein